MFVKNLETYKSDLNKLNQIKKLYSELQSGLQNGYWLEQFNTLVDGYIEGLKSGIDYEEHKGMNCLTCGYSMSLPENETHNGYGFDQLFCTLQQEEVEEKGYCDDYN